MCRREKLNKAQCEKICEYVHLNLCVYAGVSNYHPASVLKERLKMRKAEWKNYKTEVGSDRRGIDCCSAVNERRCFFDSADTQIGGWK